MIYTWIGSELMMSYESEKWRETNEEKKGILGDSSYYFLHFSFANTTVDVLQYDLLERVSVKYFLFPHPPKPQWYGFFLNH